jgi:hypothetical protein
MKRVNALFFALLMTWTPLAADITDRVFHWPAPEVYTMIPNGIMIRKH